MNWWLMMTNNDTLAWHYTRMISNTVDTHRSLYSRVRQSNLPSETSSVVPSPACFSAPKTGKTLLTEHVLPSVLSQLVVHQMRNRVWEKYHFSNPQVSAWKLKNPGTELAALRIIWCNWCNFLYGQIGFLVPSRKITHCNTSFIHSLTPICSWYLTVTKLTIKNGHTRCRLVT